MKERRTWRTLAMLLLVLMLVGAVAWLVSYRAERNEVGKDATELLGDNEATPYTTLDGAPFSFSEYRGRIRVVNVWASWSPFTATELPILNEIVSRYGDDHGVVAIAVNRKEQKERAAAYLQSLPAAPNVVFAIDETDAFYQSVGGYAMPETLVFNEAGDIVWHYRGVITYDLIAAEIDRLLQ